MIRISKSRELRPVLRGLAGTVALVGFVALCVYVLVEHTGLRYGSVVFLLPVVVAATQWGLVCALVAVVLGVLSAAFFLYTPTYSLHLSDPRELINLTIYTFIAIITSYLARKFKEQLIVVRRREAELGNLYAFARRLALASKPADIHSAIEDYFATVIQRKVVLFAEVRGALSADPASRADVPKHVFDEVIEAASGHRDASAGLTLPAGDSDAWLIRTMPPQADCRVIAVHLGRKTKNEIDDLRGRINPALEDAIATLERLGVVQAMYEAQIHAQADRLRDAFIGSVSHGLRTPLASILGAATVLSSAPALRDQEKLQELARAVREEAGRLNNDIQNLLDATRVSSDGIKPRLEWADPADIVNSAVEDCRDRLAERPTAINLAHELPLIYVDPILIKLALVQVIDNAVKYSPAKSKITVTACVQDDRVLVSITDEGAGLTYEEQALMWDRFSRGSRHLATTTGSGLGLWIASAFVAAHAGKMGATSGGLAQGTTVELQIPATLASTSPLAQEADEQATGMS